VSEERLKQVVKTGRCHAVVLTLDAPVPGKRELDEKLKAVGTIFDPENPFQELGNVGIGQQMFAGTAADLTWKDLKWLRNQLPQDMPIILKGIQTYEDAVLAASASPQVTGIILSNHGGRAMDQSQPPLMVLQEIRKNSPEVFDKLEVYLDGGIRRGTDVVKALCLGAKQVGIGRPALYGLSGYGEPGVERVIQILRREVEIAMRLLGVHSVAELGPQHVNTKQLDNLVFDDK
jgi:isopentenyl diphosphate isomerase/L-lactate dehydrogenase-like FMN-dependent dehydrogenase